MKKRYSLSLFAAAVFGLFAGSNAQAGPNFIYNWSPPGGDTVLNSDHGNYQLGISDEGNVPAGGSTLAVATDLTLVPVHTGTNDTFGGGSAPATFKLGVVINDGGQSNSLHPLFFNVAFRATITDTVNGPTTNLLPGYTITPATTNSVVVNGDTYTFTNPVLAFPNLGASKSGALNFQITETIGNGQKPPPPPPPPNDSPEPSTLLLGCFGLAGLGVRYWKKRNA